MQIAKDYICGDESVVTIEGVFNGSEDEWAGCLSISDPRIEWESNPEEGWVYSDFSFRKIILD